jgi:palmitoyltransferase ZDHHC13/17
MQELTLTGGTLLSDSLAKQTPNCSKNNNCSSDGHNHQHHNHHAAVVGEEKKECCKHHHHHNHNHNHNTAPAASTAGGGTMMPTALPSSAVVTLNMPASQLVQQHVPDVLKALKIVTRMGSMALLQEIMQAWKEHIISITTSATTTSSSNSKNKADAMLVAEKVIAGHVSQCDAEGHSLLHWAAKRADGNAAFCQFWTRYISPITMKTNDGTGMTCLHWACTENTSSSMQSLSIIKHLLSVDASLLEMPDASGCTPLLIAAQYGQVTTAAYLISKSCNANYTTSCDENRDTATHWAAYKGSKEVLGLLVYYLQARHLTQVDAYGQLPLHLAALRGHVSVCRYIVHSIIHQDDHERGDGNDGGSGGASHTAKVAAMTRHKRQALECLLLKDKNGRTPEELARHKNKPVVAAALQQMTQELQHQLYTQQQQQQQQKRGGRSTKTTTAALIKTRLYHACWHPTMVILKSITSKHRWMVWLGMAGSSMDEQDEAPYFPFHYVIANTVANFVFYWSVFLPVFSHDMNAGVVYDYLLFHVFNMIVFCINIVTFIYTHRTDPGRLVSTDLSTTTTRGGFFGSIFCCTGTDKKHQAKMNQIVDYWRRKYEETLESYADDDYHVDNGNKTTTTSVEYQLCHSCHLARPLRSKHDKYSHACILLFDHYCPFVGTSIGLYNYKYFYSFLLTMTLYFSGFWYLLIVYISRHRAAAAGAAGTASDMPWMTIVLGIYLGLHVLLSGGMLLYHTQLVMANLTTNEHLNMARYDYLWVGPATPASATTTGQAQRRYKNPWFKGWWGNLMDRFHPSEASYMLPEQHEGLLPLTTNNNHTDNHDPLSSVV